MDEVIVEAGDIAKVTINRPEKRNALTIAVTQAIAEGLAGLEKSARAVILTGAGQAFCAGGDFADLRRLSGSDPAHSAGHLYEGFQRMIRTIRELEIPVIAAVNGPAMGAGMDLALACDLRLASEEARFGQVWARLGIIPGTGGAFWTTLLAGPARAAQLILSGEVIDAKTALAWGLVNEVVEPSSLLAVATEFASTIAANPRGGVAANKKALNEVIRPWYEAALAHAFEVQPGLFAGEEFRNALQRAAAQSPRQNPAR